MNKPELMTFTKWHFENGMEVPATMKVWARKMAAEQTDPFIVELCDYGFAEGEAQAIRSIVIGFMLGLHDDGRTLGERHGWAVRYAQYILNGGSPHNEEESTPE